MTTRKQTDTLQFVVLVRSLSSHYDVKVYGPYISRDAATHDMDTDISPRTPIGYSLGVYPLEE